MDASVSNPVLDPVLDLILGDSHRPWNAAGRRRALVRRSMPGHPRCRCKPAITRLGTLASALILNPIAVNAAVATDAWHAARGSELRPAFVNHQLADGVHYPYQFHADGTFTGFNMGKAVSGNWRTLPDTICWTWVRPAVAEECFTVERNSANFRFVRDGIEIFAGTLVPAKAQVPGRGVSQ